MSKNKGFFHWFGYAPIDPDWDDDGGAVLARCTDDIDRCGIIGVHPDGYDSAPLQTPLLSRPGDDLAPFVPLLPQLRSGPQDMEATFGHWLARRHERDRRKDLPVEETPPPPKPKPSDAYVFRPVALWGGPPPLPKPTVTLAPPPPPLPEIDAPDLERALLEFYRRHGGHFMHNHAEYVRLVRRYVPEFE